MPVRLLLAASAAVLSPPLVAQAPPAIAAAETPAAFDRADGEKAVSDLATALDENFVFPEAGKKYAAMLRTKLRAGGYSSFKDAKEFTEAVTADLQAVHKDGHLRLNYVPAEFRQRGPRPGAGGGSQPQKSAVTKAGCWPTESPTSTSQVSPATRRRSPTSRNSSLRTAKPRP
jgi:hypothetical protein